jgi:hypothetical protein
MNNYRKIDSYCDYKYEIIVTNIETEFGKAFVINVLSSDPDLLKYGEKYISFDYDMVQELVFEAVGDFESFVDGLDLTFDEILSQLKFDKI